MAATNPPIAKAIYLCDEVLPDPANRKVHLLGVFNAVRLPAGDSFPFTLGRLCVFAQMEDGLGEADVHVVAVSALTAQVVFSSPTYRVRFPDRLTVVSVNVRLADCPFPAAGEYWVELYCDGDIVGDRVLHVLV